MSEPLRVAYTLEQCWHDVPGGTTVATLRTSERLARSGAVELIGVAGRHRRPPPADFRPAIATRVLPLARPWLYEAWNRLGWPPVERATGPIDVCHSTTAIPAVTRAPHVVTIHDVAFVHTPERFTRHGARVMRRGLERCRSADLVLCPSAATFRDLERLGFDAARMRVVPWGVAVTPATSADSERVAATYDLPDRFVLFVGTVEPRKNLTRLAAAMARLDPPLPLIVAGTSGWGEVAVPRAGDVRFLGYVPEADLGALYAAAAVLAYPALEEGFGLPVLEAMAHGTPVVTSAGTATEETAGGAAVLVEPTDVAAIAAGIGEAIDRSDELRSLGRARAAERNWDATAAATIAAYREVAA